MARDSEPFTAHGEDGSRGDAVDAREARALAQPEPRSDDGEGQPDWLAMSRSFHQSASDWFDTSVRKQIERNMRAFQSRHPNGSKYFSDAYKHRTKLFRPTTRAMMRQGEAAAAMSFFANEDVINVSPIDDENESDQASAAVIKELLQYRLTVPNPKRGIPWFRIVIGAYQDAQVGGVVISKQSWEFEEVAEPYILQDKISGEPVVDANTGQPVTITKKRTVIDRPRVDLYPPENCLIDPNASWLDPVNTSAGLILKTPMYVGDVEKMMARNHEPGGHRWLQVSRQQLLQAKGGAQDDSTRQVRNDNRADPQQNSTTIEEHKVVWVHENFMTWQGQRWVYLTAGTGVMLSEPTPVTEIYHHCDHNELPVVIGCCMIETHKLYPAGKPQLVQALQEEANDVVNLRLDNQKLALMKRFLVRRGRQVDLRSLTRSSPGAATLVTDESDVIPMEFRDVTGSSFMTEDRINLDMDNVMGSFSPGSIQSNRRMNETVGGMSMLQGAANLIGELDMRVFVETWAEPVLRQVTRLEQVYESDITILKLAAAKAQLFTRFGADVINDELLTRDLTVRVNVGLGATDPMRRLQKFGLAAQTLASILGPALAQRVNADEVIKEVMSALGYRDGRRFFKPGPDPIVLQLQQQLEELQQTVDRQELAAESKIKVAEVSGMAGIIETILKLTGAEKQKQAEIGAKQDEAAAGREHERGMAIMGNAAASNDRRQQTISDMRRELMKTAITSSQNANVQAKPRPSGP